MQTLTSIKYDNWWWNPRPQRNQMLIEKLQSNFSIFI